MDLNVRYWDDEIGITQVNYFTSRFFEHRNVENIHQELQAAIKPTCKQKIIQLSMDGPNTNWKEFDRIS